jgi:hypothetical protein
MTGSAAGVVTCGRGRALRCVDALQPFCAPCATSHSMPAWPCLPPTAWCGVILCPVWVHGMQPRQQHIGGVAAHAACGLCPTRAAFLEVQHSGRKPMVMHVVGPPTEGTPRVYAGRLRSWHAVGTRRRLVVLATLLAGLTSTGRRSTCKHLLPHRAFAPAAITC